MSVNSNPHPQVELIKVDQARRAVLTGPWTLRELAPGLGLLRKKLGDLAKKPGISWDLTAIDSLDSTGASLLWDVWGERWPAAIELHPEQRQLLQQLAATAVPPVARGWPKISDRLVAVGEQTFSLAGHGRDMVMLFGQLVLDIGYLLIHPQRIPWREISATVHKTGTRALGITGLVGLLIGIVISYLSSMQLKMLGAERLIVDLLGIGVSRELGPLLAAILVAGRSGSAITAELGVMRITQELDALEVMGIPPSLRLLLPKIVGLALAMPLIVVWTNALAIFGGMIVALTELDITFSQFWVELPDAIPMYTYLIGIGKSLVFGVIISLVACHFGLRVKPNTESLGAETTHAVVTAITLVMVADAVFAILLEGVGMHD